MKEEEKKKQVEAAFEKSWNTHGRVKIENYAKEIIKTTRFKERLAELRKKYDIPENGFPYHGIDTPIPEQFKERPFELRKRQWDDIEQLCSDYGLHFVYWSDPIESILWYDRPLEVMFGADLCMLADLFEQAEEPFSKRIQESDNRLYPIAIRISPHASLRDIIDYVQKNAYFIKQDQERYLQAAAGQKIGKIKNKNKALQDRNDFIYENRDLPRREIMRAIGDKFGPEAIIDYGHISKIISLEKKKRNEL